ncbi:MAG: hypothetical protein ABFS16_12405, partial [Bacteroidota bacterium]
MKSLALILIIFLISSCTDEITIYRGDGTQINIFLVKDGQLDYYNPEETDLESLELEGSPWLKHSEIEFYDWSAHTFYLKNEKTKGNHGQYFVLKADKKPLFIGFFYSMIMSYIPSCPTILTDGFFYPKDLISLNPYGYRQNEDLTPLNSDFRKNIENSGLLREGISVELISLKRKNSSTLTYSYKVTNLDSEKIYILDPKMMGASRFHYYTNGIYLNKGDKRYYADDFETTSSDKISSNWYFRLSPGKSITRTVELNGYTSLPTGTVKASFRFPGAS